MWTDEDGMQRSELAAPSILINTITVHFIGNPREEQLQPNLFLLIYNAQRSQIIAGTKMCF